ncbi:protein-tyrosine-phosphatase [Myroides marinus]|uniref:Protein-tyrosine-phosphatase n=2 Tax=Myroides marinus TaxID=703342 RepID=A0A161S4Y2_9FLAO|nr:protein-tyrosine-phosphatase [Myroides marinus]KZE74125.1 protein-tyrosine-phosphatase [Myroides marinus]
MYPTLFNTIEQSINKVFISEERKELLQPLIYYIQGKVTSKEPVQLNFICTHNSRRSHLAQIWAEVALNYFSIPSIMCYSGGTEETALYPTIILVLKEQGFIIDIISSGANPIYVIKYQDNYRSIIGFSKRFDSPFNPKSDYVAVMTCSQADEGCPYIAGANLRLPIMYEDPKISDGTEEQMKVYRDRSLEIGAEMFYVMSQIKK